MLDINFIRENQDKVKEGSEKKGFDPSIVDRVLKVDETRRQLIIEVDKFRQERNKLVHEGKANFAKASLAKGKKIKEMLRRLEPDLKAVEEEFKNLLSEIPNLPADDVPEGKDESENVEKKKWGKIPKFNFKVRDHLELGESLEMIDVKRAGKVSGTRFGYLKNEAVLLEFALINYAFDCLIKEGFTPTIPPALTQVSVFHKLGYSEHGGNEGYYLVYDPKKENPTEEANYYLVGTAEHSIIPYYMNEILKAEELPRRFVGFSTCFRREAGTYGKDTRGIFRVHQFDKIEMVSFTKPEDSDKEHEFLLSMEEKLTQALEIPYRVVKMCTGDLGAPVARKYDIECWIPSEGQYRETHSTSTCTDFQARRLNIKYRDGGKTEFVHTLNGTAFAIGRMIIAILENFQQKDGSVLIPKVLQKYTGFDKIKPKK